VTAAWKRTTVATAAQVAVGVVAVVAALRLGASFLLPIVIALMLSQLLGPLVRGLMAIRWPAPVAAGVVVLGFVIAMTGSGLLLAGPAASWASRAPQTLAQIERKIQRVARPLQSLERAAQKVESATSGATAKTPPVQVARPGLIQRLSSATAAMVGGALSVIFLTYFLLAAAPLFRRKLAAVVPRRTERLNVEAVLTEVEGLMSRYLLLTTITCVAVGVATGLWLHIVGMPNAGLWGVVAGVLNFVPYIGAVGTLTVIGATALVSFEGFQHAIIAMSGFGLINLIEGNLLTPTLLGRKLPLNAVAMFVGFLFWGWVWGVAGAILAVPMTVLIKIACDQVESTRPIAVCSWTARSEIDSAVRGRCRT